MTGRLSQYFNVRYIPLKCNRLRHFFRAFVIACSPFFRALPVEVKERTVLSRWIFFYQDNRTRPSFFFLVILVMSSRHQAPLLWVGNIPQLTTCGLLMWFTKECCPLAGYIYIIINDDFSILTSTTKLLILLQADLSSCLLDCRNLVWFWFKEALSNHKKEKFEIVVRMERDRRLD